MLWIRDKSLALAGNRTPGFKPVAISAAIKERIMITYQ
jgi:hypothetical protein